MRSLCDERRANRTGYPAAACALYARISTQFPARTRYGATATSECLLAGLPPDMRWEKKKINRPRIESDRQQYYTAGTRK